MFIFILYILRCRQIELEISSHYMPWRGKKPFAYYPKPQMAVEALLFFFVSLLTKSREALFILTLASDFLYLFKESNSFRHLCLNLLRRRWQFWEVHKITSQAYWSFVICWNMVNISSCHSHHYGSTWLVGN